MSGGGGKFKLTTRIGLQLSKLMVISTDDSSKIFVIFQVKPELGEDDWHRTLVEGAHLCFLCAKDLTFFFGGGGVGRYKFIIIYLLKYIYTGLANYIAVFFLGVQLKN